MLAGNQKMESYCSRFFITESNARFPSWVHFSDWLLFNLESHSRYTDFLTTCKDNYNSMDHMFWAMMLLLFQSRNLFSNQKSYKKQYKKNDLKLLSQPYLNFTSFFCWYLRGGNSAWNVSHRDVLELESHHMPVMLAYWYALICVFT